MLFDPFFLFRSKKCVHAMLQLRNPVVFFSFTPTRLGQKALLLLLLLFFTVAAGKTIEQKYRIFKL